MFVHIGADAIAHHTVRTYGRNWVGDRCMLMDNVILGFPSTAQLLGLRQVDLNLEHADYDGCVLGNGAVIRTDAVIYADVRIGDQVRTGHKILIRENTTIGNNVLIGTNTVIDNDCTIGNNVSIQSCVYIPTGTVVGDYVFFGPSVTLTNDLYPIRKDEPLMGVTIKDRASLGANCVILPGVTVGEGAFVAAGATVTKDVPDWHMALGTPARFTDLPEELRTQNKIV